MNILFVSPFKLGTQHGLYNAVWNLAVALSENGNNVTILRAGKIPSEHDIEKCREKGITLLGYKFHRWYGFWRDEKKFFTNFVRSLKPDIVHIHYVRVPKYFIISKILNNENIPFVISLHGGMNPIEMKRRYFRKKMYWMFIEQKIHEKASGIHFISEHEKKNYLDLVKSLKTYSIIPNVVIPRTDVNWRGKISFSNPKFLFLGRYDVWHKGIDLTLELLRIMRKKYGILAELHLYGSTGGRFDKEYQQLVYKYSDIPIIDHGLISDERKKLKIMAEYDFYIQYSRFEVFGMSIGEALSIGMPVIISENCDLSVELSKKNACIKISMDPEKAAQQVIEFLGNDSAILSMAENGRKWISENCSPEIVSKRMVDFYKKAISLMEDTRT